MKVQVITEIDASVFKGLLDDDGDVCTLEATVPTGMEDVCVEEVRQKLNSEAVATTGRAFFDVLVQDIPKVLQLRSVENVNVVIYMQHNFPVTGAREESFASLYSLVEKPLWRKGVRAWQTVFGELPPQTFQHDSPLTIKFQEPNPLLDLCLMKKGTPVEVNLPEELKLLREQHGQGTQQPSKTNSKKKRKNKLNKDDDTSKVSGVSNSTENVSENRIPPSSSIESQDYSNASGITTANNVHSSSVTGQTSNMCSQTDPERKHESGSKVLENGLEQNDDGKSNSEDFTSTKDLSNCHDVKKLKISTEDLATPTANDLNITNNGGHVNHNSAAADDTGAKLSSESAKKDCTVPSFRVTCLRSGTEHAFGSQEAARQLGSAINDRFSWPVQLENYHIDVILNIATTFVYVALPLTREAMFRRNLVAFGPTNLRSTLSYSLMHLARPQPGDVILDHMCGGASIPIEGSISFPGTYHLGGDLDQRSVERARTNVDNIVLHKKQSLLVDIAQWDTTMLPLRDRCVDVVVSDLPFGRRSGSKLDNRVLYLRALKETARVTRPSSGRAVLLTHDRNSMIKNLRLVKKYWRNRSTRTINIGGLYAGVFLLHRTCELYSNIFTGKKPSTTEDSIKSSAEESTHHDA
uniref:THUMP domain-containing protein 3-like isoform X2 n=1 Tax=Hirondellea gigas TaxID=1518452 RepID=A0A6A7FYK6_9CRUS